MLLLLDLNGNISDIAAIADISERISVFLSKGYKASQYRE